MIGIYKITSPSNKTYIGQSININRRITQYKHLNCKNQTKLYNSLQKYGWEQHKFEIIEECPEEYLNELETWWKLYYNCVEDGLNCNYWDYKPMRGKKHSKESNIKRSKSALGNKNKLGKTSKGSGRVKGCISPFKNKNHTLSTKEKMKLSKIGIIYSKEHNEKISKANSISVKCIETFIEYKNIKEAENNMNISSRLIREVCKGIRDKAKGYTFKYI
jgi:group I intron endonuclease